MGREEESPLTQTMEENAIEICLRLRDLELEVGEPLVLTSGYRPPLMNAVTSGGATKSLHQSCEAVDLRDQDHKLSRWCVEHLDVLTRIGFWLEHPASAKDHVHLQILPPKSGRRVFYA